MGMKSVLEWEKRKLDRLRKYQLPHRFKKIGLGILLISFVLLFVNSFTINEELYRVMTKYGILIGLLLISISKEKIEDELITKLRMQSYSFAFIMGVVYTLLMPFVDFGLDMLINPEAALFKDLGDFLVLWMLLSVQVCFFELLKRRA